MLKTKKCYLCQKTAPHSFFLKLGHRILKCPQCHLYSLDFEGDYQKFITTYYSKGFFTGGKLYRAYADYAGDKSVTLKNMRKYLTVIKKYLPAEVLTKAGKKTSNLLDLGCAMGYLIQEADRWKYDSYGVDISSYAVDIAKKLVGENKVFLGKVEELDKALLSYGWRTWGSPIERPQPALAGEDVGRGKSPTGPVSRKFAIVTMFDLIEHLENPRLVLEKVEKVLDKDGLLVIQTGDADSFWARLMGKNWHFFAPPQHFYFYSQKNITELLRQSGFKVIKIQKMGKWVSLRYLFHMMRYINKDSIGDIMYNFTAKNFLGQIPVFMRMNDNMIVLAKKI